MRIKTEINQELLGQPLEVSKGFQQKYSHREILFEYESPKGLRVEDELISSVEACIWFGSGKACYYIAAVQVERRWIRKRPGNQKDKFMTKNINRLFRLYTKIEVNAI